MREEAAMGKDTCSMSWREDQAKTQCKCREKGDTQMPKNESCGKD